MKQNVCKNITQDYLPNPPITIQVLVIRKCTLMVVVMCTATVRTYTTKFVYALP